MSHHSKFNRLAPLAEDDLSRELNQYQLSLTSVGYFKAHKLNSVTNASLPCHRICYMTGSPVRYTIHGAVMQLSQGDVLYTPPNTIYSAAGTQEGSLPEYLYLYFKVLPRHKEQDFIPMMETSGKIRVFHALHSPVEFYFRTIMEEYEKLRPGYYHKIHSYLMLIIMELLRRKDFVKSVPSPAAGASHTSLLLNKAVSYISANIKDPLRISQVSRACGVSESYLYRIFISGLGMSPKDYILKRKMEYAGELLREGTMTVTQIGRELGFSNPNHFSNAFVNVMGVRPSKYPLSPASPSL